MKKFEEGRAEEKAKFEAKRAMAYNEKARIRKEQKEEHKKAEA